MLTSLTLSLALLFGLVAAPGFAYASATDWDSVAEGCGLEVRGGTLGEDYVFTTVDYNGRKRAQNGTPLENYSVETLRILTSTPLEIRNKDNSTATDTGILIAAGVDATVTLSGVNIEAKTPFNMENPADGAPKSFLTLILADGSSNTITATAGYFSPAIRVPKNASLLIDDSVRNVSTNGVHIDHDWEKPDQWGRIPTGTAYVDHKGNTRVAGSELGDQELSLLDSLNPGTLTVTGGFASGAIGGGPLEDVGPITIDGGNITAYADAVRHFDDLRSTGAGIGTGMGGIGTGLVINGGVIRAHGSGHGAAIGSGCLYGEGAEIGDYRFTDAIGGVAENTTETMYRERNGNGAIPGDITINGGFITAEGSGHGHSFGHGCYSANQGHKIVITGGTLLPETPPSAGHGFTPYDIGGVGCAVYILGGSVRVLNNKYQANINGLEVHDRAYGPLDANGNRTEVMMCKINLEGLLKDTNGNTLTGYISVLDAEISGIPQSYGMPACTDDKGMLYLWLPKTENASRIEVKLRVIERDEEGNETEVNTAPFFIESSQIAPGATLKQYVLFDTDTASLENAGLLNKRYDGLPLGTDENQGTTGANAIAVALVSATASDGKQGIPIDNPPNTNDLSNPYRITEANLLSFETTAVDAAGSSLGRATEQGLPVSAGYSRITLYSSQYSHYSRDFEEAYWGHRSQFGLAEIEAAESLTEVVGVKVTRGGEASLEADEDGNVTDVSAVDTLRFYANVSPYYTLDENGAVVADGTRTIKEPDGNDIEVPMSEAATCAAPEGKVAFYLVYYPSEAAKAAGTPTRVLLGERELNDQDGYRYAQAEAGQKGYAYSTASYDLDLADNELRGKLGGSIPSEFTVVAEYRAQDSGSDYVVNYNASSGLFPTTAHAIQIQSFVGLVVADRELQPQGYYGDVTSTTLINAETDEVPTAGAIANANSGAGDWAEANKPADTEFVGWTDNPRTSGNPFGTNRIIEDWETVGPGVRTIYPVYRSGSGTVSKSVSVPEDSSTNQGAAAQPHVGGTLHYVVSASVSGLPSDPQDLSIADCLSPQVELIASSVRLVYADGTSVALSRAEEFGERSYIFDSDTRVLSYRTSSSDITNLPSLEYDVTIKSLTDASGSESRTVRNGATVVVGDWAGHGGCESPRVMDAPLDADAVLLACWREEQANAASSGPNYPKLGYIIPNLAIGERITLRTPKVASVTGYEALYEYYPDGATSAAENTSTTATVSADAWAQVRAADGGPMPNDDAANDVYWAFLGWTDDPRTSWNPTGTDRLLGIYDVVQSGVNRVYPVYGRSASPTPSDGTPGTPGSAEGYIMEKGLVTRVETVTIYQELEYKVVAHNVNADASWENITFMDKFPAYAELVPGSVYLTIVDYSGLTPEQIADGVDGEVLREYALEPSTGGATWEAGRYNYDSDKHMISHRILKGWLNNNPIEIGPGQSCELRFKIYVTRDYLQTTTERQEDLVNEGWVSWYPPVDNDDPSGYPPLWVAGDTAPIGQPGESAGDRWIGKVAENLTMPGAAARIGDRIRYTITVGNDKSYRWEDVRIRDAVPAGLDVDASTLRITGPDGVEHTVDAAAWDARTRELVVAAGTLEEGERAVLTFEAVVGEAAAAAGADIGNVASAGGNDPYTSENPPSIGEPTSWPWGTDGTGDGTGVGKPVATGVCYPPHTSKGPIPYPENGPRLTNICEPNDPDILTKTVEVVEDPSYKEVLRYTVTLHNPTPDSRWDNMEIFDYLPEELVYIRGTLEMTYPDGRKLSISDDYFDEETHIFEVPVGTVSYGETYVMEYSVGVPSSTSDEIELVNRARVDVPSSGIPATGDSSTPPHHLMALAGAGAIAAAVGLILRRRRYTR